MASVYRQSETRQRNDKSMTEERQEKVKSKKDEDTEVVRTGNDVSGLDEDLNINQVRKWHQFIEKARRDKEIASMTGE